MVGNRRDAMVASLVLVGLICLLIIASIGSVEGADKVVRYPDMRAMMGSYNSSAGTFSGLSKGDIVQFNDTVATSWYNDATGRSELYFVSTGTSEYGPKLEFIGPFVSEDIKEGSKVSITAEIVEVRSENRTVQAVSAARESITVLKEAEQDGEPDSLEVYGVRINLEWLPKGYRTPLVRFLLVFAVWSMGTLIIYFLMRIAMRISAKTKTDLDQKVIRIVRMPMFTIITLYGLVVSSSQLDLSERLSDLLSKGFSSLTIILIAIMVSRVFRDIIIVYLKYLSSKTETQIDDVLVPVIGKMATVIIWVSASILFLQTLGVDITVFVAGMGILGLVIAFAAQDTLSNFFSGLMIMLDRPFKEGDWIMLDTKVYQVKEIGLRSTRLHHSMSNQTVTIPNNRISDHLFSNLSEPDLLGRSTVEIGVSYNAYPKKVGAILLETARAHKEVLKDKDHVPYYRLNRFSDSSIQYEVTFWVKDYHEQWRIASEIRESIYERFEKEGIEIPFPQRVVHLRDFKETEKKPGKGPSDPANMSNLSP